MRECEGQVTNSYGGKEQTKGQFEGKKDAAGRINFVDS